MGNKPKPYVTAALLCERVIQEKDESLTIVRIADRVEYRLEGPPVPAAMRPVVNLHGLLSLKSGPVIGEHTIKVLAERPNGERKEISVLPLKFSGKDQGQNVVLNMTINADQDGLYWFDVVYDEELLTRIPLMIIPAQEKQSEERKNI